LLQEALRPHVVVRLRHDALLHQPPQKVAHLKSRDGRTLGKSLQQEEQLWNGGRSGWHGRA
jgi:hypothetical protein